MFAGREASFYAGWGPHMPGQVYEASSRTAALSLYTTGCCIASPMRHSGNALVGVQFLGLRLVLHEEEL